MSLEGSLEQIFSLTAVRKQLMVPWHCTPNLQHCEAPTIIHHLIGQCVIEVLCPRGLAACQGGFMLLTQSKTQNPRLQTQYL